MRIKDQNVFFFHTICCAFKLEKYNIQNKHHSISQLLYLYNGYIKLTNNFIVFNLDLEYIANNLTLGACCVCLQWNAAPWICNPVFCMRWSLLTNQSASRRLAMPISPRHEREGALSARGYHRAASPRVTAGHSEGSTAAGCAVPTTL